jgi:hypothetical protein
VCVDLLLGGCPKTSETQLAIIIGILLALVFIPLAILLVCLLAVFARRFLFYWSIQADGYIPTSNSSWKTYDVLPETVVPEAEANREATYSRAARAARLAGTSILNRR